MIVVKLLLAVLGERLCEQIRPTERYIASAWVKVNDTPWEKRRWGVGVRRPWQRRLLFVPGASFRPSDFIGTGNGEVSVQEYTVVRKVGAGGSHQ